MWLDAHREPRLPRRCAILNASRAAPFGAISPPLSVRRRQNTHDLWWIFNPTNESVSVDVLLSAVGSPYIIDLWTGRASVSALDPANTSVIIHQPRVFGP